ncbi:MAG: AbrB/MazE/SpoVT family DNA-binding domain-containing protein [Sulfurisoma sp.]|nr:AbrB/MazE/SpoVT family DNA-binding domain-containing protein [Sulfurisoma sp.]
MPAAKTARLFMNGSSQAVRLPKEFRLEGDEVVIRKVGDAVMLIPKRYRRKDILQLLNDVGPIELAPRDQGNWNDTRA